MQEGCRLEALDAANGSLPAASWPSSSLVSFAGTSTTAGSPRSVRKPALARRILCCTRSWSRLKCTGSRTRSLAPTSSQAAGAAASPLAAPLAASPAALPMAAEDAEVASVSPVSSASLLSSASSFSRCTTSGKMSSHWMSPVPPSGGRSSLSAQQRKLSREPSCSAALPWRGAGFRSPHQTFSPNPGCSAQVLANLRRVE
mmetsp:Transcript_82588/g.229141  ORF Transcript_82588/g.229141 Transcript_82588/m.229141 type:complete len:201 (+) Transcript_82588:886-1488(+)